MNSKSDMLISRFCGLCICAITVFATQIANSACIWWMHQPKEPDSLR